MLLNSVSSYLGLLLSATFFGSFETYKSLEIFFTNSKRTCSQDESTLNLQLYLNLPSDLIRTAPVLLISALPFAQNVVFPVALMFPKQLLSSHFWSDQVMGIFKLKFVRYYLPVDISILLEMPKWSETSERRIKSCFILKQRGILYNSDVKFKQSSKQLI